MEGVRKARKEGRRETRGKGLRGGGIEEEKIREREQQIYVREEKREREGKKPEKT